jgi:hypothetical protein
MRFEAWRLGSRVVLVALLSAVAACSRGPRDLLFVYSGDCQGYVEPCG